MSTYLATVAGDNSVAVWPLNETSGTVARNYLPFTGVAADATYVGSPTLGASWLIATNYAVETGSGSCVSIPYPTTPGSFTFEFWFSCTGSSHPLWRDSTSGSAGWLFDLSGTNPLVRTAGLDHTVTSVTSASLLDGERHYFALVVYFNQLVLFLDGTVVDTWSASVSAASIVSPILLGKNGTASEYTPAVFAAAAIYSGGLSDIQVAAHYAAADNHVIGTPQVTVAAQPLAIDQTIPLGAAHITVTALPAPAVAETLRYLGPVDVTVAAQPIAVTQTFHPIQPLVLTSYTTADIDAPLDDPDLDAPNLVLAPLHVVSPSVPTPTLVDGRPT